MQTDAEVFRENLIVLIAESGGPGVLKCSGGHDYDPSTGETTQSGAEIDVTFAVVSTISIIDQDPKRRAIQRDTGLDKLAEGRILFYIADGITEQPSETGWITDPTGTRYTFSDLRPYIVQGQVIGYEALHRGVRDGL